MILIVEDNKLLGKNIKTILDINHFESKLVKQVEDIDNVQNYELIILDINLPGQGGFEFLKKIRLNNIDIPVLILTSKNTIDDKVKGLELGADDYITKPFDISEFIARIKAILRRNNKIKSHIIQLGKYKIDIDKQTVMLDKMEIGLSSLEFKLLTYFLGNKGKILSRQEIYENVWGDFYEHMFSRTIDVYISYLRKKLGGDIIKTKKGSGYYME